MTRSQSLRTRYGSYTAISIVVANMIGTGIFTSLGFQVMELHTGFALIMLWAIGGITALIGAMAYAELGTRMPRSGGEYHFLSRIYHPALGFVSGWISFIVGFAAPTAAAAMALSAYFTAALNLTGSLAPIETDQAIAIGVILLLSWMHVRYKRAGAGFQNIMTSVKIIILLIFILIGGFSAARTPIRFIPTGESLGEMISPAFAVALFFVSFAYSGWNASAYIAGEMSDPGKNIPRSLTLGTGIVTLLYLGITWVFLRVIPIEGMQGKIEIGYLFGRRMLGEEAGSALGILFSILLLSTVSSLIITGPRVTQVMGEDYARIRWFSKYSRNDTPARAIYIQAALAIVYILTSTFEQMITYIGFTLNLMTLLTVLGMIILRERSRGKAPPPYLLRPYPLLPVVFLLINLWIMVYGILYRPVESLAGLVTGGIGFGIWLVLRRGS